MEISKEGNHFLEQTRSYLNYRGKDRKQVKEFIQEAHTHILDGENDGKTVEEIFGSSPKKYAKDVAKSMDTPKRRNLQLFMHIYIAILTYVVIWDAINGDLAYSWIEIIGYTFSYIIWVLAFHFSVLLTIFHNEGKKFIFMVLIILPAIILLDVVDTLAKNFGTPLFTIDSTSTAFIIIATTTMIFFINLLLLIGWKASAFITVIFIVFYSVFGYFSQLNFTWTFFGFILLMGAAWTLVKWDDRRKT